MLFPFWPTFLSFSLPFFLDILHYFSEAQTGGLAHYTLSLCLYLSHPRFGYSLQPPDFVAMSQPLCLYFPPLPFSGLFSVFFASVLYAYHCRSYKIAIKPRNIGNSLFFFFTGWTPLMAFSGLCWFIQCKWKLKYMRQGITDSLARIDRNS